MIRFKIDKETTEKLDYLNSLYGFKRDTITLRIAFAVSLNTGFRFDENIDEPVGNGREYTPTSNVFGNILQSRDNFLIYKAMLDQHYDRILYENEFVKFFKLHSKHGVEVLSKGLNSQSITTGMHYQTLLTFVKKGLGIISNRVKTTIQNSDNINLKESKGLIEFELGTDENGEPVKIRLNDLNEFDSNHIAVAGMTGSGKTQLIKDILYQIAKQSNNQVSFIFFDYKGEQKEKLTDFLEKTNCSFVDVLKDNYEFNPLSIINSQDEDIRDNQILTFSDILCGLANLGTKQGLNLRKVIRDYFEENKNTIPTIEDIYDCLQLYYEETKLKPDTLIDIFDKLSRGIFAIPTNPNNKIYNQNIYLNLPSSIPETVRQLTVFFTLKYLLNIFSNSTDTQPDENRIKPLRYIVVIDEAHVYLKNKNARSALQEMLRVVRSKGVVVIMLSQGADDYRQKDFDFSSQVKIPICLNVKNRDYRIIEPFVGTPSSKFKLEQAINKLQNGYGVINIKEPKRIEIRQFWKTIKEE